MALGHFFLAIDVEAICDLEVGNESDGWSLGHGHCCVSNDVRWVEIKFDLMMIATGIFLLTLFFDQTWGISILLSK